MTYLIGERSPGLAGTGLPTGASPTTPASDFSGLHAYASRLYRAIWSGLGSGIVLSVPRNRPATDWVMPRSLTPGWGPLRFAFGTTPLPFATYRFLSAGLTLTDVGYQPTG